ncbi:GPI mannosyltransferase 3-like isoform X1 [Artemia franciscana]|uniref:GPI mannosyltransferase 3-like isoform X1 n=1 Tax=Artemia franciscana TaxID=6661 RepID=UPI0032D9B5CC
MWKLVLIRLSTLLFVQTWFVPDEYWQSTEVSHRLVFGSGELTWEFDYGLRSSVIIIIYALIFKTLKICGLDKPCFIIMAPRFFQLSVFTICEIMFLKAVKKKMGAHIYSWTYFFLASSWFVYYTCSRTLANTTELILLYLSLSGYGFIKEDPSSNIFYISGFISCLLRPTAVIFYAPLALANLFTQTNREIAVLVRAVPYMLIALFFSIIVDSYFYNRFIISQWNFIKFNVLMGGAAFFGTHHCLWYLTEGLPPLFGPVVVLSLIGFLSTWRKRVCSKFNYEKLVFGYTTIFACLIYSLQAHKEHRFLLPVVPFMCVLAATASHKTTNKVQSWIIAFTLLFNIPLGFYFSLFHQRAPLDVVRDLAAEANVKSNVSVLFLLPCHSTPMFSHVHYPIEEKYFTCVPNFNNDQNYVDEADRMFLHPIKTIEINLLNNFTYVIIGSYLEKEVMTVLKNYGYVKKNSYLHQLIPDGRIGNYISVYELSEIKEKF